MIVIPILTTSPIHFSLKGWESVLFKLMRVKGLTMQEQKFRWKATWDWCAVVFLAVPQAQKTENSSESSTDYCRQSDDSCGFGGWTRRTDTRQRAVTGQVQQKYEPDAVKEYKQREDALVQVVRPSIDTRPCPSYHRFLFTTYRLQSQLNDRATNHSTEKGPKRLDMHASV